MIKLNAISKQYSDAVVLDRVDLTMGTRDIVGLIGENGSGKTTLMDIIRGAVEPDSGTITVDGETIAYLPQNPEFPAGETVADFLKQRLPKADESYRIDMALATVGLVDLDRSMPAEAMSGGQKTKLFLASLLIADPEPTYLLLDEPTNNLDLEGITWLESFLLGFPGGVLLISHDRALLDNIADTIIELDGGRLTVYGGNYSFYREQKEIAHQAELRRYTAQQKEIAAIEETIAQMKARAKAAEGQFSSRMPYQRRKIRKSAQQAVYRQRALEKFLKSQDYQEKPEESIEYRVQLSGKTHAGKTIVYVHDVRKAFGTTKVLHGITVHLGGKERIWLTGRNGSGKSTLLKIISGLETPDSGTVEIGTNVQLGYFSQSRNDLHPEMTVRDELMSIDLTQTEAYKLGIRFGFVPDDMTRNVKELSWGQRAKISFAKLTAGQYQVLVLDEPTNHLDIKTREVIEEALIEYPGALLISSHDRFFMERLDMTSSLQLGE